MECLESKSQLSIGWKFIYPIIDHKFKYKSLLKPNGEDNVFRYTIHRGKYTYFDTVAQKMEPNGNISVKSDRNNDFVEIQDNYIVIQSIYYPKIIPLISFNDCDIMNKISNKKYISNLNLSKYFPEYK